MKKNIKLTVFTAVAALTFSTGATAFAENIQGGPQGNFGGPQGNAGGPQGNAGGPQGNFGGPQGNFGGPQGNFGGPQGNFGGPQGNFGGPQGNFGGPQGNFGGPQGNFGGPQGNFGGPQRNFGGPQRNFGGPQREIKGGMQKGGPMGPGGGIDGVAAVLAELVKAGIINQEQSNAISKALINAPAAAKAAAEAEKAAHEKLIADNVGLAWAEIETRLQAGETLGAIAGAAKDALIAALLKEATDRIDAAIAAGRLTAEEATVQKTGLAERITADVASVKIAPGKKVGKVSTPKPAASPSASPGGTNANSTGKVAVKQAKTTTTTKVA
jgi:polyhydroxyalkanoate synthesis regulator phasin